MQNNLVLCAIVAFIAWYYFAKLQDSEKEYNRLHRLYVDACNENEKNKNRIEDLQSYKQDVTKTFQILDNELLMINDHIKNQNTQQSSSTGMFTRFQSQPPTSNRISILTPDLLNTLFNESNVNEPLPNINTETTNENDVEPIGEPSEMNVGSVDNVYSKYLINEEN